MRSMVFDCFVGGNLVQIQEEQPCAVMASLRFQTLCRLLGDLQKAERMGRGVAGPCVFCGQKLPKFLGFLLWGLSFFLCRSLCVCFKWASCVSNLMIFTISETISFPPIYAWMVRFLAILTRRVSSTMGTHPPRRTIPLNVYPILVDILKSHHFHGHPKQS